MIPRIRFTRRNTGAERSHGVRNTAQHGATKSNRFARPNTQNEPTEFRSPRGGMVGVAARRSDAA
jgi:hypothetical protein